MTDDLWLARLRLSFEFIITVLVLLGAYLVAVNSATSATADSGAAAVVTLVIGYWFGRGASQASSFRESSRPARAPGSTPG